jgi:hypothetical protein
MLGGKLETLSKYWVQEKWACHLFYSFIISVEVEIQKDNRVLQCARPLTLPDMNIINDS